MKKNIEVKLWGILKMKLEIDLNLHPVSSIRSWKSISTRKQVILFLSSSPSRLLHQKLEIDFNKKTGDYASVKSSTTAYCRLHNRHRRGSIYTSTITTISTIVDRR
ncbi:hypothetical protein L6452_21779 [Arctium lappa]|uniref:Uncharacterized protein n=1 Tax=Arctium lappa TaxID=4217 RepID=A0ACB9AYU4_ARCLA|nr:hypothetical protein L6452_21779 [Arctium lappa]